jgi:hypothetical protein
MKFELKHCQTFKEAEELAGNGWDLVSVIPSAGFYFKKPVPYYIQEMVEAFEAVPEKTKRKYTKRKS